MSTIVNIPEKATGKVQLGHLIQKMELREKFLKKTWARFETT
jgi:hypothetical protein